MLAVMGKQDEMLRSFGRRFQLLRQEKDLSQTAIAAMLQSYGITITASHLSLVEKNKRNVSVDLLVALARLLETSTDYLLVLTDDPTPADKKDVVPYCSYALALRQLRRAIVAIDTLDIDALLIDDNDLSELLLGQIAEQEATIERTQSAMQRADDAFVSGTMDGERYRRQVDRLMSQMSTAQAEIDKLRTRHANEADTAARRQRIESVSSEGIAKLDGDPTTGNAWLRRHVRMWAQDGRIVSVEWL